MSEETSLSADPASGGDNQPPAGDAGGQQTTGPAVIPQFSVSDKGEFGENWQNSNAVPEEYRNHPSLQNHKTFQGFVTSYVEGQKMVGADKENFLFKPSPNDPQEKHDEFHFKLGVPKTAGDYEVDSSTWPKIKDTDEQGNEVEKDLPIDEAKQKAFLEAARTEGKYTNAQANFALKFYAQEIAAQHAQMQQHASDMLDKASVDLKADKDFGGANFDQSMKFATAAWNNAAKELGFDPKDEQLQFTFRSNPMAMKILGFYGRNFTEAQTVDGNLGTTTTVDLEKRIEEIVTDPDAADTQSPRYAALNKELDELLARKHAQ